jgi:ABC-2 type transport system ATP-binding protein
MIAVEGLTKRYGSVLAVDDLTFTVQPGVVTGFLGPNGAGKSTTMRLLLGLDTPTSGRALVLGRRYRELACPLRVVGAVLDAGALHPGRTAEKHLAWLAASNGIASSRVDEVLDLVGLSSVAKRRAGGFSLGMRQRLGIAASLLGDPEVLLYDEPVNGLDPEGIVWVRNFLRALAKEGKTVLVSSHLMAEMALTAERLIVIGRGRLIADSTVEDFVKGATEAGTRVVSPDADRLTIAVVAAGGTVTKQEDGALVVSGLDSPTIGKLALKESVELHELSPVRASLEDAYMELTADSVEYGAERTQANGPLSYPEEQR